MPRMLLANNVSSTLAVALTASTTNTTLTVATGTGALFPTIANNSGDFFLVTLTAAGAASAEVPWQWGATMYYEIVKVTARTGDVMTVVRIHEAPTGQNPDGGSIAAVAAWPIGSKADLRFTSGVLRELEVTTPHNAIPAHTEVNQVQRPLAMVYMPYLNSQKKTPWPPTTTPLLTGAQVEPLTLSVQVSTTQNFATIFASLTGQSVLRYLQETPNRARGVADVDAYMSALRDYVNTDMIGCYMPSNLAANTTYWWRVKAVSTSGHASGWSTPTRFTTAATFNYAIATPAATPAIGAAFEGGYYAGTIWQLANNARPSALGFQNYNATPTAGSLTTITNQSYPTHYVGQVLVGQLGGLQTRTARTQYWQKYSVASMTSSNLTVTSIQNSSLSGAGNGVIMARFRIIVAPKATGETTLAMKNDGLRMAYAAGVGQANTAQFASSNAIDNGQKCTEAMFRGTSPSTNAAAYPAANWARNLSIGGYTDWYIPARDELELMYRNLRPSTTNNSIVARSGTAPNNFYDLSSGGAQGGIGDTTSIVIANGINDNSEPVGAAYTATVPARTAVALFQTGGAQALAATVHWSSTPTRDSNNDNYENGVGAWVSHRNWAQNMANGQQDILNYQASQGGAINTATVRAVRRSIL